MENKTPNWKKFGIYIAATVAVSTCVIYIADMKERISNLEANSLLAERLTKLEVKIENFEKSND